MSKSFSEKQLKDDERELYQYANQRIDFMRETRKDIHGIDIDELWREAQQAYIPHRFNSHKGTKAIITDEEKGLRGAIDCGGGFVRRQDCRQAGAGH